MNILNLPDEMLLTIFERMNMVDVFYSLMDVNLRFHRLVLDHLCAFEMNLTNSTLLNDKSPIASQLINRLCEEILTRNHRKIIKLIVQPITMKCVLLPVNYSQLRSLVLLNFELKSLLQYLTGDTTLRSLLTHQITNLQVYVTDDFIERTENEANAFELILSSGKRLIDLTYSEQLSCQSKSIPTLNPISAECMSVTLSKLKIEVNTFDDCLTLLDGRLPCLSTLITKIYRIQPSLTNRDHRKPLPKLKCFSLTSGRYTRYEYGIVSLLRRMSNLEELTLFLVVAKIESTYIDGIWLHNEVLVFMPRLSQFTFSIHTFVLNEIFNINVQSNEDLRNSFIKSEYQHVGLYADEKLINGAGACHVFSLPYQFDRFILGNCFQGDIFEKVSYLTMFDQKAFEHEFFEKVSHAFPFLKQLKVKNSKPQQNTQHVPTLIQFTLLEELDFHFAHIDYVEQFLLEAKSQLPRLQRINVEYESLVMITNHFTNEKTRRNCSQVRHIDLEKPFVYPENFYSYFPSIGI